MHVLLVDDESLIARPIVHCGRAQKLVVEQALDCASAMAAVLKRPYDALLLDLRLPDGNGIDLLRTMRRHGVESPVVIYSAYATMETALVAGQLGVFAIVQKPGNPHQIVKVLCDATDGCRRRRAEPFDRVRSELAALGATSTAAAYLAVGLRVLASPELNLLQFAELASRISVVSVTGKPDALRTCAFQPDAKRPGPAQTTSPTCDLLDVIEATTTIVASEVAVACGVPRRRLACLALETGRDIRQWARLARVKRALVELVRGDEQIAQCAYRAGYPTARQFSRDCRTELRMRPKTIRQLTKAVLRQNFHVL